MTMARLQPDGNGFALNPPWRYQVDNAGNPPDVAQIPACTTLLAMPCSGGEISIDEVAPILFICDGKEIDGHANYELATYTGDRLHWRGWQRLGDRDYCFDLETPDRAGMTAKNGAGLHVEFSARETVDHFRAPWWQEYRKAARKLDLGSAQKLLGGPTVVTGLLGLDCVHQAHAEVHPVLAMAVQSPTDDPTKERWGVFARSRGDEGACSHLFHSLPPELTEVVVRIPWSTDSTVTGVAIEQVWFGTKSEASAPALEVVPGHAVQMKFAAKDIDGPNTIDGEVNLRWLHDGQIRASALAMGSNPAPEPEPRPTREERQALTEAWLASSDEEDAVGLKRLPADQQDALIAAMEESGEKFLTVRLADAILEFREPVVVKERPRVALVRYQARTTPNEAKEAYLREVRAAAQRIVREYR